MGKKCKPTKYAVVTSSGTVTYGFRCAKHKIYTRRYATQDLRDIRLREHKKKVLRRADGPSSLDGDLIA